MILWADEHGGDVDLDDFEFPTTAEVGGYCGDKIAKNDSSIKVMAAAISLHLVMGACWALPFTGYLMNGHFE